MIEQLNNTVKFMAFFTASKQGKTGITVTIDVFNPSGTKIITDGSCTELGDGIYTYTLANTNTTTEGEYIAVFKTTDSTVDMQHIPSLWVVGRAGVEHLDGNISDKATQTSVSAIPTNPLITTDTRLNNLDATISSRATQTSVNSIPTSPLLSTDTRLNNLDATISSRASQTTVSAIPTNPLLTNDSRLDNLDAKISTISGGGSPMQSTDSRLDKLANLDVAVSTRATGTNQLLSTDSRLNNLTNLDATVSSRATQSSVDSITGSGKTKWTYTLTLSDDVTPIPDANVWITTDLTGNNIIASTITDSYGQANFAVDKGTIYVWCAKAGYKFNNPDMEVIA